MKSPLSSITQVAPFSHGCSEQMNRSESVIRSLTLEGIVHMITVNMRTFDGNITTNLKQKISQMKFRRMSDLCHRSAPPSPAHSCTATAADMSRARNRASARSGHSVHHPSRGHTWTDTKKTQVIQLVT